MGWSREVRVGRACEAAGQRTGGLAQSARTAHTAGSDRMQCALCGRSYTLVLVPVLVDQCQPRRKVTVQA